MEGNNFFIQKKYTSNSIRLTGAILNRFFNRTEHKLMLRGLNLLLSGSMVI